MPLKSAAQNLANGLTGTSRGLALMMLATIGFVIMQTLIRVAGEECSQIFYSRSGSCQSGQLGLLCER